MDRLEYSIIVPAYQAEEEVGDCIRALIDRPFHVGATRLS